MLSYATSPRPRRTLTFGSMVLLVVLFVALVGGGTVASLWALGMLPTGSSATELTADHGNKVAVLMAGMDIPAYTRVTRDHLINPETKEAANFWLAPEQIPPGVKLNISDIAGRVLKHDKRAGYFFTEDDFLPTGTRPGIVAGIPAGKRSITLDATKIAGVAGLRAGDRIDIVASRPSPSSSPSPASGAMAPRARRHESTRSQIQVVVENGAVVLPVYLRGVPTTTHSMSGQQNSTKPVQEVVLAIEPNEVAALTEALASSATLMAVARSGLPTDPQESRVTIEVPEEAPPRVIEVINGKKRDQVVLPTHPRTAT